MKYLTKIVAVLFCLVLSSVNFSVLAEDTGNVPQLAFTKMTPDVLRVVLGNDDVKKVLEREGLSMVLGYMAHDTASRTGRLNGLEEKYKDGKTYAEAWVKFNNLPPDLTDEQFFQIRDSRGLFFLTPGFLSPAGSNDDSVIVSKTETPAKSSVIKPSVKPERDPVDLFAERLQKDREQIATLRNKLASLRAQNATSSDQVRKINELEKQLNDFSGQLGRTDQELRSNFDGLKQDFLNLQSNQTEIKARVDGISGEIADVMKTFNGLGVSLNKTNKIVWGLVALSLIVVGILIALWRFKISTRRQFADVNGRVDDLEEQVDDLEERVDEEVVDLSGLVIHDEHLLSKENINSLSYDKDSDNNSVSVLVTKPFGSDTAEITVTVTRINKNQLKVNIPRNAGEKRERIVDINTRSLVRMIKKADRQDLLFPVRLKQVS